MRPSLRFIPVLLVPLSPLLSKPAGPEEPPRVIHVFVALCDNKHQGIVPVPEHLGRGDDPKNNLYWGCSGGVKHAFSKSQGWERVSVAPGPRPPVLERAVFKHRESGALLLADAYEGKKIGECLKDFLSAVSGNPVAGQEAADGNLRFSGGSGAELAVFLGHNPLMDLPLDSPPLRAGHAKKDCIVLCCKSEPYFSGLLEAYHARPVLLTARLMYPGAMVLEAAAEGWLKGEGPSDIRERAAQAYAKNQKINVKAARGIFWDPPGEQGR